MSRLERPTQESSNPAQRFLEWKSNEKTFSYYDKEKKENITVDLPFKFLFLEHYHTVKGWNDKSESAIYSNEVFSIGMSPLTVKSFKGGEIATGLYKDIKDRVKSAGGHYTRSIYGMLEDGSIINLQLKGSAVGGLKAEKSLDGKAKEGYSDFYNNNSNSTEQNWISVSGAAEGKSGSVKYSIPQFVIDGKITTATDKLANVAANTLGDYMKSYIEADKATRANSEVTKYEAANVDADLQNLEI